MIKICSISRSGTEDFVLFFLFFLFSDGNVNMLRLCCVPREHSADADLLRGESRNAGLVEKLSTISR